MTSNKRSQHRERRPTGLIKRPSRQSLSQSSPSLHQFDDEVMVKNSEMGPQTIDMEYKSYTYPWDFRKKTTISQCICGFLNSQGGTILIGIKETEHSERRIVKGENYSEQEIEQLKKVVTKLARKISPMVVANNLVKVKFIPVIDSSANPKTIHGHYVIKIIVEKGWLKNLRNLYHLEGEYFFRTENEVLAFDDPGVLEEIRNWRVQFDLEEKMRKVERQRKQPVQRQIFEENRQISKPSVSNQFVQTDLSILNEIGTEKEIERSSGQGMGLSLLANRAPKIQDKNTCCVLEALAKLWEKFMALLD